jgi:DNA-binding CsgD family transcriptional regulator
MAAFQIYDTQGRAAAINVEIGFDPAALKAYEAYYSKVNPWLRNPKLFPPGAVMIGEEIVTFDKLRRTEFHHDFGKPSHVEHTLGCNLSNEENAIAYLSLNRRAALGMFQEDELHLMRALAPHLRRAARVGGRVALLHSTNQTLSAMAGAVLVIDRRLRILEANADAEGMLRSGQLLCAREGTLDASEINCAALVRLANGLSDTETLQDASGQEFVIRAVPLALGGPLHTGGRTLLMVRVPGTQPPSVKRQLAVQFELTEAEIRLIDVLLTSRTLANAADTIGISVNTAKTHLARIFRKTGTSGQRQLVQLILGIPGTGDSALY